MNKVVILIISHKAELNVFEQISLKQCYKILGHYPIKFICPEGLDVSLYKRILPNPQFDFIDPVWQSTYANFNKLKINPLLYTRYKKFEYILFYEPDAFVFRDELDYWCEKGYDYIGAPWFNNFHAADEKSEFVGIGNGGFSLRKTKYYLNSYRFSIAKETIQFHVNQNILKKIILPIRIFIKLLFKKEHIPGFYKNYTGNEDIFWTVALQKEFECFFKQKNSLVVISKWFYKKMIIPDFETAIKFSFELKPEELYEVNNKRLPFGCHAWFKYKLEFWESFIKEHGYELPIN